MTINENSFEFIKMRRICLGCDGETFLPQPQVETFAPCLTTGEIYSLAGSQHRFTQGI